MVIKFDEWDPFGEESSEDREFEEWLDKYYNSHEGLYFDEPGENPIQTLYSHKGSERIIFQTRERLRKSFEDRKKIIGG